MTDPKPQYTKIRIRPIPVAQRKLDEVRAGEAARDAATESVASHARPEWREEAYYCIKQCAYKLERFTVDDVWDQGLSDCHDGRAIGAVMKRAARDGLIVNTHEYQAARVPRKPGAPANGRAARVWKSLVYGATP